MPISQQVQSAGMNDRAKTEDDVSMANSRPSSSLMQLTSQKSLQQHKVNTEAVSAYVPNPQLSSYNFTGIKVNDRFMNEAQSNSRLGRRSSMQDEEAKKRQTSLTKS